MDKILKLDTFFNSFISEGGLLGKNGFFDKNKYILLLSFICGIFANSTDIFNFKVGLDSERALMMDSYREIYFLTNRYASVVLSAIFPFFSNNVISQVTGIFFLSLACLLSVYRLNVPYIAKAIFCCLVVSYPNFSYLEYFFYQYSYNMLALLIGIFAYLILTHYFDRGEQKGGITYLIIATLLLTFSISSYQTNFALFIIASVVYIFFKYQKENNFKRSIKELFIVFLIVALSFIIYYLICSIFGGLIDYHSNKISWLAEDGFIKAIGQFFTGLYRLLIGVREYKGYPNIIALLLFLIFAVYYIKRDKRNWLLILALFVSFFSVVILFGKNVPNRAELGLPFYFGFSFFLAYPLFKNNIWKGLIIILSIITFFINSGYINNKQQAQLIQYQNDKIAVARILDIIYDKAPSVYKGEKKLIFIGKLSLNNRHPIFKNAKDTFAGSFFNWYEDINEPLIRFAYIQGVPTNIMLVNDKNKKQKAKEIAKSMPSYPARDCVKVEDDYVIVKLGE